MKVYICTRCRESYGSRQELERYQREAYPSAVDQGPTGTPASGQSGTTPPTGTGGVTAP
jgi:hypothetical protein